MLPKPYIPLSPHIGHGCSALVLSAMAFSGVGAGWTGGAYALVAHNVGLLLQDLIPVLDFFG